MIYPVAWVSIQRQLLSQPTVAAKSFELSKHESYSISGKRTVSRCCIWPLGFDFSHSWSIMIRMTLVVVALGILNEIDA